MTIGSELLDCKNSMPVSFGIFISRNIRSTCSRLRVDCAFSGLSASPAISKKEISSIYSLNNLLATGSSSMIIHFKLIPQDLMLLRKNVHRFVSPGYAFPDIIIQGAFLHLQFLSHYDRSTSGH